jgi:cell division protein DivIC
MVLAAFWLLSRPFAMKFLTRIPSWIRNKYLIASVIFFVWIAFFDSKDLLNQYDRKKQLQALQKSKAYFEEEIANERKALEELKSNPAAIEKYAREKYLMKKDDEDLFLIQAPPAEAK